MTTRATADVTRLAWSVQLIQTLRSWARPLLFPMLVVLGFLAPTALSEPVHAAFTAQTSNTGMSFTMAAKFWPSGLAHHWPFEGDAVDTVASLNGTVTGTTTITGRIDNALDFDEVDDHVTVPDFAYSAEFTMTFDFKVDDNSGSLFKYMYSHGGVNASNSINVYIIESGHSSEPDTLRTAARDGDDGTDTFALDTDISSFVADGKWHTYALVASATTGLTLYLDGTSVATDSARGQDGFNPACLLYLGGRYDLNVDRFHGGGLDTVQIYDRVLTPTEITNHAS